VDLEATHYAVTSCCSVVNGYATIVECLVEPTFVIMLDDSYMMCHIVEYLESRRMK
jgi:hypothetical protein